MWFIWCFSLENSTSEIYKLRKSDDEKKKRINSFKIKLDSSDGAMNKILGQKDEEINTLTDEYDSYTFMKTTYKKLLTYC